ncbi:putative transferase [Helianthus annuus]|nr:putative transferase [Helianthus annuus]
MKQSISLSKYRKSMGSSEGLKSLKHINTTTTKDDPRFKEEDQPLSPMARLFHEPGSNVYIVSMMGCKTKINPDVIKQNLVLSLVRHPRFSSLQVTDKETGNIKWVPTNVNIDNHVIVPEIDPNIESADKFVEDYISNLSRSSIDRSQPLWDLHLLNIKTTDAEGTGVFRFHHSLGDGMSLMTLLLACTRQASDTDALPTLPMNKDSAYIKVTSVWSVLVMLWNSFVAMMMFVCTGLFLKDTETPLKGSAGVENRPRRFVRKSVSLADVKAVKNAMNVTLNDVVLGVTQAGLSRYLNYRYGEINNIGRGDRRDKKDFIPKGVRLRATFFFNLRATTRIDTLVESMKSGTLGRWGNQIGYVLLPFAIGLKRNPLDYVKEAKAVIDKKKVSLEPLFAYFVASLVLKLFGIKAVGKLNHKVFFNTTLWFSNVPGPEQEVTFYGQDITYIAPSCYGQPNALMIHIVSYMDKLTFVISADEETIPDPHRLGDDLVESLQLIKASALAKESTKDK